MCSNKIELDILLYLLDNPRSSIHMIAKALGLDERDVLLCVETLCEEPLVKRSVLPLDNLIDPNCSVYYSFR